MEYAVVNITEKINLSPSGKLEFYDVTEVCVVILSGDFLHIKLSCGKNVGIKNTIENLGYILKDKNFVTINEFCYININNIKSIKKSKFGCCFITNKNIFISIKEKYHFVISKLNTAKML